MTQSLIRLATVGLSLFMALASSSAFAAGPNETPPSEDPPAHVEPAQFAAHAGVVASSRLGVTGAIDTRLWRGLHLGVQGGTFGTTEASYRFIGGRVSYRFAPTEVLRVTPSMGIAHVVVESQVEDDLAIVDQAPLSVTAGLEVALQFGIFLAGCDFEVMPTRLTRQSYWPPSASAFDQVVTPAPATLFVGATF